LSLESSLAECSLEALNTRRMPLLGGKIEFYITLNSCDRNQPRPLCLK
jgi:hypothetical protein